MEKKQVQHLAIFGGTPFWNESLYVGQPNSIDHDKLFKRFNTILDSKWLTNDGQFVKEFEQEICKIAQVKHAVAVTNATLGLELLIAASDLHGEVIIPSFTFVATAHALLNKGITPVFADIRSNDACIDPNSIASLITERTTGIVGVHCFGNICDIELLESLASQYNLKLLFDAAHAFGCKYKGIHAGNFGEAEVFSFHATKHVNSAEGGAIVTNDDVLAKKLRLMRNFGFSGYDKVDTIGTNAKMNEFSAAVGLTSLESRSAIVKHNAYLYRSYRDLFAQIPGITLLEYPPDSDQNYHYIVITNNEKVTGLTRDQIAAVLQAENIMVRKYFHPGCHKHQPYKNNGHHNPIPLPVTEAFCDQVICFPTGLSLSTDDVKDIADLLRFILSSSDDIKSLLLHSY